MNEKHLAAHVGQYALLRNHDNKVLLLERARSKTWCLPGGRLNEQEEWDAALLRELHEEINLTCSGPKPVAVNILTDDYQVKYCVYFRLDCQDMSAMKLSDEHSNFGWFSADGVEKLNIEDDKVTQVILDYLRQIPKLE